MTLDDYYSQSYPPALLHPREEIIVPAAAAKPRRRSKVTVPVEDTSEPADE